MHVGDRPVLLRNARIYTRALPAPSALLIIDGHIAWMGLDSQLEQFGNLDTIDCQGKWLSPAFADAHVHVTNTGVETTGLSLKGCSSVAELSSTVTSRVHEKSSGFSEVVIGHGWDDSEWAERPEAKDIDVDVPVYLSRVDVHSALINDALVRRCPEIASLAGWDGSGRVTQSAHALARQTALGLLTELDLAHARSVALRHCASVGIVAVDEMAGPVVSSAQDARAVFAAGQEAGHPEVFVWWGELFGFETARELNAFGCGGDLFVDGSIGSRTACLHDDYTEGGKGVQYIASAEILEHVERATALGVPTGFHAIGDNAIDDVMHAFSHIAERRGIDAVRKLGHRIEHAEMTDVRHFSTASSLNLGFSVQPQFDALWAGERGMYSQRLGARHVAMNNFAGMAAAGNPLLLGSDSPVTDLNPWRSLLAATSMNQPAHSLSKRHAFSSHTRSFWRQRGQSDIGVIEVGAVAHLALWDVPDFDEPSSASVSAGEAQRWSLDLRSGISALPNLEAGLPHALQVWKYGTPMLRNGPVQTS